MTRCTPADHSTFDLPLDVAHDRMAELRASARPAAPGIAADGPVSRTRDAIGRRLIALGSALVVDEPAHRHRAAG
ncbi:MAG TPA: hypothetical protein VD763_10695 [Candidatus Saccharimonadales bacterium]|nr:hypothetical protein [Candidatus Saccharimonadales bacterium]